MEYDLLLTFIGVFSLFVLTLVLYVLLKGFRRDEAEEAAHVRPRRRAGGRS